MSQPRIRPPWQTECPHCGTKFPDASPSPQATPSPARGPSPTFWVYIDKARMSPDIATSKGWLDKALAEVGRTNPGGAPSLDKLREAVGDEMLRFYGVYIRTPEARRKEIRALGVDRILALVGAAPTPDFIGHAQEVLDNLHAAEDRIQELEAAAPAGVDAGLREALGLARRLEEVANALNGETFIPINPTTLHAAARHIRSLAARPHPEEQGAVDLDAFEAAVREEVNAGYMHSVQSPEYKAAKEKLDGLRAKLRRPEEQGESPDLDRLQRDIALLDRFMAADEHDPEYCRYELAAWKRVRPLLEARSRTPSQGLGFPEYWAKEAAGRRLPAYFTEGELKGVALDAYCAGLKQGRSQGGANG